MPSLRGVSETNDEAISSRIRHCEALKKEGAISMNSKFIFRNSKIPNLKFPKLEFLKLEFLVKNTPITPKN